MARQVCYSLALVLAALLASSSGEAAQPVPGHDTVTLRVKAEPAKEVIKKLRRGSGLRIRLPKAFEDKPITIDAKQVSREDVIRQFMRQIASPGYAVIYESETSRAIGAVALDGSPESLKAYAEEVAAQKNKTGQNLEPEEDASWVEDILGPPLSLTDKDPPEARVKYSRDRARIAAEVANGSRSDEGAKRAMEMYRRWAEERQQADWLESGETEDGLRQRNAEIQARYDALKDAPLDDASKQEQQRQLKNTMELNERKISRIHQDGPPPPIEYEDPGSDEY